MKRLEEFAAQRIRRLNRFLKDYPLHLEDETLHSIRVEIKKIKTVLQCLEGCLKEFKYHRRYKPFRDIFRKAGAIREQDVFANLLLRYEVQGVKIPTSASKQDAVKSFIADTPIFLDHLGQYGKGVVTAAQKVRGRHVRKYLKKEARSAKDGLYPHVRVRRLHKTRKLLKELLYLSEVAGRLGKRRRNFLREVEDLIGRWHDKQTLLGLLQKQHEAKPLLEAGCHHDLVSIRQRSVKFYLKE